MQRYCWHCNASGKYFPSGKYWKEKKKRKVSFSNFVWGILSKGQKIRWQMSYFSSIYFHQFGWKPRNSCSSSHSFALLRVCLLSFLSLKENIIKENFNASLLYFCSRITFLFIFLFALGYNVNFRRTRWWLMQSRMWLLIVATIEDTYHVQKCEVHT